MLERGDADLDRIAVDRGFQIKIQIVAQIRAARGTLASAAHAATEDIGKDIAEDIAEPAGARAAESAAPGGTTQAGMAELVVGGLLLIVGQHLVGFRGLLEACLGLFVARIAVRVILHGQAAVGLLDLILRGAFRNAQNLVVVAFCHGRCPRSLIEPRGRR